MSEAVKTFKVVLIKPSRYDDSGYVVQWVRSGIPSNSLAVLYALVKDCADRQVLGPGVTFDIEPIDEANVVIPFARLNRELSAADYRLVGLVGVQTNQFARALDIARTFRSHDALVVIGGFHVSGCRAMLDALPTEILEALDLGVSIFAGEAEGRVASLLNDAANGQLKPIYDYLEEAPSIAGAVTPILPRHVISRTFASETAFDASRGCPYQCSFCTIINIQGRSSRARTPDDVERIIRENARIGVRLFIISDDNFARNSNWESILDRLIELRERAGFDFSLTIQVDLPSYRIPRFIDKAARAGCKKVFLGMESINPQALISAKKNQNKIWEYRKLFAAWRAAGIMTYVGYIVGFPTDTPETIARDIRIIQREIPLDLIEFFILTPLPGSEDHRALVKRGVRLEQDTNQYNVCHVTVDHPLMTRSELYHAFRAAWRQYYSAAHVKTMFMRARITGSNLPILTTALYAGSMDIEGEHPLEIGLLRRKIRQQRRPGMPIEPWGPFYARRLSEVIVTNVRWGCLFIRYWLIKLVARWLVARDLNGDLLANNEATPLGARLMDAYFAAIPDTQRRTVPILEQLQARMQKTTPGVDSQIMTSSPPGSPQYSTDQVAGRGDGGIDGRSANLAQT
jgi:radical SAM superfamily enzyme YgiQ (UPF0313 family)